MRDRETCIDCGRLSPETDTNYTLISAQFGWRLTRKRLADETFVVEWRCGDCWKTFKSTQAGRELAQEPVTAPRAVPVAAQVRSSAPPRSGARSARASSNVPRAIPPARPRSQPAPKAAGAPSVAVPRPPGKPSR